VAVAERAAAFNTVAERQRATLVAAAAAEAQIVQRSSGHAIARTTDPSGNLRSEFLVLLTPDGSWELDRYAIGLPAAICEALASEQ